MLNTLKMPLIHDNDNFLGFRLFNLFKEVFVLNIDEDTLKLGEESSCAGSIPVDLMLVHALFSESCGANQIELLRVISSFLNPE